MDALICTAIIVAYAGVIVGVNVWSIRAAKRGELP